MQNSSRFAVFSTPAAARIIPFAVFVAFISVQVLAADLLRSMGIDARWFYPARTLAVALLLLVYWRHYTELRDCAGLTGARILVAVGAGIAVFFLWINLDFGWAMLGTPRAFDPTRSDGAGIDWLLVGLRVFGLAIIVPIMEELFWRSFLQRWIDQHDFLAHDPAKASLRAILICAVLFGSEHNLWLAGLLAGLVYSIVYVRGRNLWLPIISHATTNAALAWWIVATGHWQFW